MSKWRYVDEWSDDDPAIRRLRDALALRLVDARGRAVDAGVAADSTEDPVASLDPATRRERVASLVRRLEDGDQSAVEPLRRLLPGEGDERA
jgi:hypothetical protein